LRYYRITEIQYEADRSILRVLTGSIWREFWDVPEDVYKEFIQSKNRNRYYEEKILNSFICPSI